MQSLDSLYTTHPRGSRVLCVKNGRIYTVVGYLVKNGVIVGTSITVANDDGIRFVYGAADLTLVDG